MGLGDMSHQRQPQTRSRDQTALMRRGPIEFLKDVAPLFRRQAQPMVGDLDDRVPIARAKAQIDFAGIAAMLNLEVIVVVGNRPGCVDATMLTLYWCESRKLKVAGYILCDCDPISEINDESLQPIVKVPYLGRMRHREPLVRTIVEKLI